MTGLHVKVTADNAQRPKRPTCVGHHRETSTPSLLAASVLLILLALCAPAYAEDADPWIALPRADVAALLAKSAELDARIAEVAALRAVIDSQTRQIDAQARLIKTLDDVIERQAKLTALADEGAAIHEKRAARIEEGACKQVRAARVTGYAATGAAAGSVAFPGIGTLVGGAIGAAVGFFMPCP